jgi:DHA1 family bicyclomycin/chloramphenicol resistance-like MFS transporter
LPDIGRAFGVSPALVQLTMASYLIGFALGQIGYGPISDWYGRRSGLIVALVCYCAGSLICLLAPSIEVLIGARVLQAFGGSGAIVLARAVVRDFYSGARAGKELSMMGLVMAFGPVSAPLIGGGLHALFGWRSAFAALLAFGLALAVTVARKMPETLAEKPETRMSLSSMLAGYRDLIRIRDFNLYLMIGATSYTGLIAWLAAVPFIYHNRFGLTPFAMSLSISASAVGYLIGTSIATRIVVRAGIVRTMGIGAIVMLAGAVAVCISIAIDFNSVIPATIAVGLNLTGFGLLYPQAIAGGLSCAAERAGAASSLLGFAPQVSAAILSAWVVASIANSAWPAGLAVLAMALIVFLLWLPLALKSARRA